MYLSETMTQANCKYIGKHQFGVIIVYNNDSEEYEHYRYSPDFAGYTIRYKGKKYEFVTSNKRLTLNSQIPNG